MGGHERWNRTPPIYWCIKNEIRASCVPSKLEPFKRTLTHAAQPTVQQMQEDRQRDIATENHSLMHRLAGIMKEDRINLAQRFSHLSVEYRESLRRKKALKLQVGMKAVRPTSSKLLYRCVSCCRVAVDGLYHFGDQ